MQPLVTAVIPVFNGEQFVGEAIESVLSQDYPNIQVVVVNDGSTDRTVEVAGKFDKVDVLDRENGGPAAARNTGLGHAAGDFVAFLDHDDLWLPGKISYQVHFLETHLEQDGVFTSLRHFLGVGTEIPGWLRPELLDEDRLGYTLSTLMVRREVFARIGDFHEGHKAEDADWFFRAKDMGINFGGLDEPLVMKRVHGNNISHDQTRLLEGVVEAAHTSIRRRRNHQRRHHGGRE